ncbi:hypothetical protein B0J14DRAFT_674494 [Halenospora varia]|nr:hypothetical protein B0J14DRAFT_674494 [Halenospora varia]
MGLREVLAVIIGHVLDNASRVGSLARALIRYTHRNPKYLKKFLVVNHKSIIRNFEDVFFKNAGWSPGGVPTRTSSLKNSAKREIEELEAAQAVTNEKIHAKKAKLKPKGSWSSIEYWTAAAEIQDLYVDTHNLSKRISMRKLGYTEDSEKVQEILEHIEAARVIGELSRQRALDLQAKDEKRQGRLAWMEAYTSSWLGLGIEQDKAGRGKRPSDIQSNFRSSLKDHYGARHPNPRSVNLWCPVSGAYFDGDLLKAAHIFPWASGQPIMTQIFGQECSQELNSVRNGILWHNRVETAVTKGKVVIVPDISDAPTKTEIDAWNASEPKEYKLRILDKYDWDDQVLKEEWVGDTGKSWASLDGQRLQFKNDQRPRARYLYHLYCVSVLKYAWGHHAGKKHLGREKLLKEQKKFFWGTRGKYLPENMLRAIVEDIGHQYEDLMDGADESRSQEGTEEMVLAVAAHKVIEEKERQEAKLEGEDDSEECEEE